ncbi:hypothetical protein WJX74_000312 [Apatococcus lobatus]|uniref:Eukaryotic translation initiation factor 2A n=1 Tax=Apatococcus lobatus TaxID=904363 RepID=A0AAW1RD82_9CHLO
MAGTLAKQNPGLPLSCCPNRSKGLSLQQLSPVSRPENLIIRRSTISPQYTRQIWHDHTSSGAAFTKVMGARRHICDADLQDALRGHLLPLLAPKLLANLRAPSRILQELIDLKTGLTWRNAAQSIIPLQSLPINTDGHAVQERLRLHANTVKKLTSGDPRNLVQMTSKRSPVLKHQLKWSPCSVEDGLSWVLMHGATSIDLHPQGLLKPCPSICLTQQLAEIAASPKTPGSSTNCKPFAKGFLLQPSREVTTRRPAALQTRKPTEADKLQLTAADNPTPLPSKREVVWCSFSATHGHLVFVSPPAAYSNQCPGSGSQAAIFNGHKLWHPDVSSAFSVLELPSLNVRGLLKAPFRNKSGNPLSDPKPVWQRWTAQGSSITILWTSANAYKGPHVAVYNSTSCKLLRHFEVPLPAEMMGQGCPWVASALAPCTTKLAVSLFNQHSSQDMLRVAFSDLSTDAPPFLHDITDIEEGSAPELSFAPSGKVLAIILEPEWKGHEDLTGPYMAYVLRNTASKSCHGPFTAGRAVFWAPGRCKDICIFPKERRIVTLHASLAKSTSRSLPVVTPTTAYQDIGDYGEGGYNFASGYAMDLSLGSAYGMGLSYGSGMGLFGDEEDEDTDAFHSMCFGQSHKKTLDCGSMSPCGSLMVALSSTEAKAQVEHWPVDVHIHQKSKSGAEIVHRLTLPSQKYDTTGFSVAWHPTLQKELMYALAVGIDALFIISGSTHRVIFALPTDGNCPPSRLMRAGEHSQALSWSPDGAKLAIPTSKSMVILQAAGIPEAKVYRGPGFVKL